MSFGKAFALERKSTTWKWQNAGSSQSIEISLEPRADPCTPLSSRADTSQCHTQHVQSRTVFGERPQQVFPARRRETRRLVISVKPAQVQPAPCKLHETEPEADQK